MFINYPASILAAIDTANKLASSMTLVDRNVLNMLASVGKQYHDAQKAVDNILEPLVRFQATISNLENSLANIDIPKFSLPIPSEPIHWELSSFNLNEYFDDNDEHIEPRKPKNADFKFGFQPD